MEKRFVIVVVVLCMSLWYLVGVGVSGAWAAVDDYSAYWKLDLNNNDSSLNGYNFATGEFWNTGGGVAGDAAAFSHVNLTTDTRSLEINSAPLIRDVGSQFTLSMWIMPKHIVGDGVYAALFDYWHTATGDRAISVQLAMWNGRVDVMLTEDGTNHVSGSSDTTFADANDTWYHVAVVVDLDGDAGSVDDLSIYVTPVTAGSVQLAATYGLDISSIHNYSGADGACKLAIGSGGDDFLANQYFRTSLTSNDGLIDEVVFYNRALSAAEVADLFTTGKAGESLPPNPIIPGGVVDDYDAYWEFDAFSNADSSYNGYDFTTGMYWKTGGGVAGDAAVFSHVNYTTDTRSLEINSAPLIRDVGSQFTLSMWIMPKDIVGDGVYAALFDYWHTLTGDRALSVQLAMWNGRVDVYLSENGSSSVAKSSGSVFADGDDTWYHVAVVVDLDGDAGSVDDLSIYVTPVTAGGVQIAATYGLDISSIHNYSGADDVCKLAIGSAGQDFLAQQYYRTALESGDGRIDEVAFYNRALLPEEVALIFELGQTGQALPLPPPENCAEVWLRGLGMPSDLNRDCYVDLYDLSIFVEQWLECTTPGEPGCEMAGNDQLSMTIAQGTVTVDGDLSEWWTGGEWMWTDIVAYGTNEDIEEAKFSLRWSPDTDKVYMAVIVEDSTHWFTDEYGLWNSSDRIEIYSQGDNAGGTYDQDYQDAQQYMVGHKTVGTGGYWATWGSGAPIGGDAEFESAVGIDGDLIVYEVGIKQFDSYAGVLGGGTTVVTQLDVDDVVRFDMFVDSRYDPNELDFTQLNAFNTLPGKYYNAENFSEFTLKEQFIPSGDCGDWGYMDGDLSENCRVDLPDFSVLDKEWRQCNNPEDPDCVNGNW